MARATSPLRYPGGKSCLLDLTSQVMRLNGLERGHYAEPYAGGCGLALALLYGGHVADIHINDIDPSIWAFWHCVLNETDALVAKLNATPVTIDEWLKQRDIHRRQDTLDTLGLGFSAFFLNRTNRSGIIKGAGVIGGWGRAAATSSTVDTTMTNCRGGSSGSRSMKTASTCRIWTRSALGGVLINRCRLNLCSSLTRHITTRALVSIRASTSRKTMRR